MYTQFKTEMQTVIAISLQRARLRLVFNYSTQHFVTSMKNYDSYITKAYEKCYSENESLVTNVFSKNDFKTKFLEMLNGKFEMKLL